LKKGVFNSKILVRRGGIFIAYVFGIPNAIFWAASRKNTQKPVNLIMPNNPHMVIIGIDCTNVIECFFDKVLIQHDFK
jgi:hypothetical protein